jgi:hypothetical protein
MIYVFVALLALLLLWTPHLSAYGIMTHEAIVDASWERDITPVLLNAYPQATPADLAAAHSRAYAGAIIQDVGYYPFGSVFFSNLVHYVRTGDFIANLIRESQTLNELAFALGALSHYAADTQGHSVATNRAVPLEYPKLKRKFGSRVTYGDDKMAHIKVEFSFDVSHLASGDYAAQSYHDFIGFQVEKDLLERAFQDTYGLKLSDVFANVDLALATYRHAVSSTLPHLTEAAWELKRKDLASASRTERNEAHRRFVYRISQSSYRKDWPERYQKPGFGAKLLAFFVGHLPKFGPLRALDFPTLTPQSESLFETSFVRTLNEYGHLLADEGAGHLNLEERDFDTGQLTRPTEYALSDDTWAQFAREMVKKDNLDQVSPAIIQQVLDYFRDPDLAYSMEKSPSKWNETVVALVRLRSAAPAEPAAKANIGPPRSQQ